MWTARGDTQSRVLLEEGQNLTLTESLGDFLLKEKGLHVAGVLAALVDVSVEWRVSNVVLLHLVCCVCSQGLHGSCVSDLFPCKWPLYRVQQVALYILY